MMKKLIISILLFLSLTPVGVFAQQRDSQGYIWSTPNTCPRKNGGIWSIEEHKKWIQSAAGQNDLRRAGLPELIQKYAVKLTQVDAYGWEYTFPTGEKGIIKDITALKGITLYNNLTFGDGQMLKNVRLGFNSKVYRIEITDKFNIKWVIDTHKICANQGDYKVNIIVPKVPETFVPPPVEEFVRYYEEIEVYCPAYQLAQEKSYQVKGIFDALSRILASIWRRPDNISMNAHGGTFNNAWTASFAQWQNQSSWNNNENYNPINVDIHNTNNNINQNDNDNNNNIIIGP